MLLEHLTVKVNEITLDFSVTLEPPTRGNRYLPCVCWNVGRCCRASSAVWCSVCFCANERTAQCPSTSFWGPSFTNKQVFPKYVMTILCLLSNLPVSGFEAGSYSCVIIRTLLWAAKLWQWYSLWRLHIRCAWEEFKQVRRLCSHYFPMWLVLSSKICSSPCWKVKQRSHCLYKVVLKSFSTYNHSPFSERRDKDGYFLSNYWIGTLPISFNLYSSTLWSGLSQGLELMYMQSRS